MTRFVLFLSILLSSFAHAELYTPLSQTSCQKNYLDLFAKDEINVTVVFGYDDVSDGLTRDKDSHDLFVKTLLSQCTTWDLKMCGFKKASSNPTVLTRKFFGPDGKIKLVKVTSEYSSHTADDKINRTLPAQTERTKKVRTLFSQGLKTSEVTIYNGHSRDGGGPSFAPPVLKKNGHVNYDYYYKNKSDKNFMIDALKESPDRSRIVGIVSCSSLRWFQKGIVAGAPATGILGTDESFYTVYFQQSVTLLESIFSYECLTDIKVDDARKFAKIMSSKDLKTPLKNKKLTKQEVDSLTIENLAKSLQSSDVNVRKEAYLELKGYDPKLYSSKVKDAMKSYTFGNTFKKNF